jgi:hypothetical protein
MGYTTTSNSANTYVPIMQQTLLSSASSVIFNTIPQGYTDLVLIANASSTATTGTNTCTGYLAVGNSTGTSGIDTGSNYSSTWMVGSGSTAGSGHSTSDYHLTVNDFDGNTTTPVFTPGIFHFQNYSNTTTYKTVLGRVSNPYSYVSENVGLWRQTYAIDTIKFFFTTGNVWAGSTFTLYGIKAA